MIGGGVDWARALLDGAAMAAAFNLAACVIMFLSPRYMMGAYPKGIRKAAPAQQTRREKRVGNGTMLAIGTALLFFGAASAAQAGVTAFWPLFWMGYAEWMVASLADFLLLDIVLFTAMKPRIVIPGTEGHPGYALKSWMLKLALPEHFLLWPFLAAPALAAAQAALGRLITR